MIAVGAECYSHGTLPSVGMGRSWNVQELEAAIHGEVSALVFDERGKADIQELLAGVVETDFEQEQLGEALDSSHDIENWQVGEALAESYLTVHRDCVFPWPDGRDKRKGGSSLPGADLVGLQKDESGDRFVFGEVKTSGQAKYPPATVHGRTGLKQQLEDLRDNVTIRDDLFKYLGYRAKDASWQDRFKMASKRYFKNKSDIQLFGVLVRDVEPNVEDIRVRVEKLGVDCPAGTQIELLAIYLPVGAIDNLAALTLATRAGS